MSDPTTTPVYCGAPSPNVARGYQVGHHLCGLMSGHDGPHHCDVCLHEWTGSPSSAPSEAGAQEADCPSSEKQLAEFLAEAERQKAAAAILDKNVALSERVRVLEEALREVTLYSRPSEAALHAARKALSGGGE